jgi:hypothetical protein
LLLSGSDDLSGFDRNNGTVELEEEVASVRRFSFGTPYDSLDSRATVCPAYRDCPFAHGEKHKAHGTDWYDQLAKAVECYKYAFLHERTGSRDTQDKLWLDYLNCHKEFQKKTDELMPLPPLAQQYRYSCQSRLNHHFLKAAKDYAAGNQKKVEEARALKRQTEAEQRGLQDASVFTRKNFMDC